MLLHPPSNVYDLCIKNVAKGFTSNQQDNLPLK